MFADNPLLGYRLALEGLTVAPSGDAKLHTSIFDTVREMAADGRVQKLSSDAVLSLTFPDGAALAISSLQTPGYFWFADTSRRVLLAGKVSGTWFSPEPEGRYVVVVYYGSTPSELRRSADGFRITRFDGLGV